MVKKRIHVVGARVLVMGLAFKENCPDLRNTRIVDFVRELKDFGVNVDVQRSLGRRPTTPSANMA